VVVWGGLVVYCLFVTNFSGIVFALSQGKLKLEFRSFFGEFKNLAGVTFFIFEVI
jgi:hypothetical protein